MKLSSYALAIASFSVFTSASLASDLTITNAEGTELASYSQDQLEAIGTRELRTTTPWTDGLVTFTGVDATKFLKAAGFDGVTVTAIALDDYAITVDWNDFERHNGLIATRMNGERMTSGNKGPFWIVFNYDEVEIGTAAGLESKSVWHLMELEIE